MFPSVDEMEAEGGMLECWLYKVCDVVGMAPPVEAIALVDGAVVEYCLYWVCCGGCTACSVDGSGKDPTAL
jgi:hypothetical protein